MFGVKGLKLKVWSDLSGSLPSCTSPAALFGFWGLGSGFGFWGSWAAVEQVWHI